MFRALVLNKNLDCNYICKLIQDMINKNNEINGISEDYVLSFRISKTIDANTTSSNNELLKLEHKNIESCNT